MNPKEDLIRDKLAEDLTILEKGLVLREAELRVKNPHGADGKIDIFAEDAWKNKVVIEIKRSDQAARQAVHELFKYTELLRDQYGITNSQVRVILLSTDWHELSVPFSAFSRDVKFPCEGFQIKVDAGGKIIEIQKVEPVKEPHLLDFIPHHMVYAFSSEARRILQISQLAEKLQNTGVNDFVFFLLNYKGNNKRIMASYAIYACLGTVPISYAENVFKTLGVTDEVHEYLANNEEDEFDFFQEQLTEQAFGSFSIDCDDFGIGYPEKAGHLASEWELVGVHRFGRWIGSEKIRSDSELWQWIAELDGKNVLNFIKETSPRFSAAWMECKSEAENVLVGYSHWLEIYVPYLEDIEKNHPKASVKISLFNPTDLLLHLYLMVSKGDVRYVPQFHIAVEDLDASFHSTAFSSWIWDGITTPPDPKIFLAEIFGDPFEYFMRRHFGLLHLHYEQLLKIHGFSMPVLEVQEISGKEPVEFWLSTQNLKLIRTPKTGPMSSSLLNFVQTNSEYMKQLADFVNQNSVGLD